MAYIELVIKMPEDEYNHLMQTGKNTINLGVLLDLREAIKNGTPLPKGHGRLIDADKLYNDYVREPEEFKGGRSLMNLFREAPTIIEADKEEEE